MRTCLPRISWPIPAAASCCGLLYLALAWSSAWWGVKKVMRLLAPGGHRPHYHLHRPHPGRLRHLQRLHQLAHRVVALAVIVVFNIWGRGMFKIIPILMGVVVSYIAALIMNAAASLC